jgi:replication initiation and membrane attachment protein DnaB|tara:strand:+ start:732 stop:986 length:255 start_codon:yes stop_codon:yes gene_type:complete
MTAEYGHYTVTIKNIEVKRDGVFAKSPLDAVKDVIERMSKIYDLDIDLMNPGIINYEAEIDQIKTDKLNKEILDGYNSETPEED